MGVIEASVLATGAFEHASAQIGEQGPGLGLTAAAMPHQVGGVGLVTTLEALDLAFTALQ